MKTHFRLPVFLFTATAALLKGRKGSVEPEESGQPNVWPNTLAAKLSATIAQSEAEGRGRPIAGFSRYH